MTRSARRDRTFTFAVFAYNHEDCIREAMEGALAQTGDPLEIIVSDDCSRDGTFAVMEEVAAAYRGPHRLILRRSTSNRGFAAHVNAVAAAASGDVIIVAAGDDVSLPTRAAAIAETFRQFPEASATLSAFEVMPEGARTRMDIVGSVVSAEEMLSVGGGVQKGATYAYARDCFAWPTPLPDWLASEDRLLPFRAAMLGTVHYIDRPLVRYRVATTTAERGVRSGRVHSFNDPRHLPLLREVIVAARRSGRIGRARAVYLLGLLRLLSGYVWARRRRISRAMAPALFAPVRVARAIAVRRNRS